MCSSRVSTCPLLSAVVSRLVIADSPLGVRQPLASVWMNYSPACDVSLPRLYVVEYGGKFYRVVHSASETRSRCCKLCLLHTARRYALPSRTRRPAVGPAK